MRELNLLVYPCGSEIGLEIYRSLQFVRQVNIFGASAVPDHGAYVYQAYFGGLPMVDSADFLDALNHLIKTHSIDYVVPAHDAVILKLAEASAAEKLACQVLTSPLATCRIARSKKATYQHLSKQVPMPVLYENINHVAHFPVFMKPDVGQGSKRTFLAQDSALARFYQARNPDLLMYEYLPGQEVTVDCYTDQNGVLRFMGARERVRVQNGISVKTRAVQHRELEKMAADINQAVAFTGAWFFQAKQDAAGTFRLLEIAPRIAGTSAFYRNMGINFLLLDLFEREGFSIHITPQKGVKEMDRALCAKFKSAIVYDHAYLDLDDCLIFRGKVNTQLIQFIYQCRNEGKGIHLLTRHRGSLQETLTAHRLEGLFDSVVHLTALELKSAHIVHDRAIFIDDSFVERKEVAESRGIPVFAPDAVESLLQ